MWNLRRYTDRHCYIQAYRWTREILILYTIWFHSGSKALCLAALNHRAKYSIFLAWIDSSLIACADFCIWSSFYLLFNPRFLYFSREKIQVASLKKSERIASCRLPDLNLLPSKIMASSFRVSASFLNGLKALFPENANTIGPVWQPPSLYCFQSPYVWRLIVYSVLKSPWYIVAAVAFSASNRPEGVPQVFEHALADLRASLANTDRTTLGSDNEKLLAQRFRDALFKSGLISGYPKVSTWLTLWAYDMLRDFV